MLRDSSSSQIEVAVARHAERSCRENFIAVVQAIGKRVHDVVEEDVFDGALRRRQQHETRQRARHRDDSEKCLRASRFFPQQKCDAQRFVQHVRKRMRRIDRHRREQRLDALRIEILDVLARLRAQLRLS